MRICQAGPEAWHETLAALPALQVDPASQSSAQINLEQLRNEADSLLAKEAATFEQRLGEVQGLRCTPLNVPYQLGVA